MLGRLHALCHAVQHMFTLKEPYADLETPAACGLSRQYMGEFHITVAQKSTTASMACHSPQQIGRGHAGVEDQGRIWRALLKSEKRNLLVGNLHHLEDGSVLGLDALQEAWLRQDELQALARLQLIVGAGLWLLLDKLAEVALQSG